MNLKGTKTEKNLKEVHNYMLKEIERKGGKIDHIYYCTDISSSSINRKPNIGMAFQAKRDFPEIDFSQSIFVGNSQSDIIFANKLGILSVLVGDKYENEHIIYSIIDFSFENLYKFAIEITNTNK